MASRRQAASVQIERIPTLQERAILNNKKFKESLGTEIETFRAYESLIDEPMGRINRIQESIVPN